MIDMMVQVGVTVGTISAVVVVAPEVRKRFLQA